MQTEHPASTGVGVPMRRVQDTALLGERLRHPGNEPLLARHGGSKGNARGKDCSSGNISWPPAAKWLEERESPCR